MKQDLEKLWSDEYSRHGIPSSFREEASGSIRFFVDFLKERNAFFGPALDLGAGTGRNSLFLARQGIQVNALELVRENVRSMNILARSENLSLRAHNKSVTEPWPFPENSIQISLDTFCYKHQTTSDARLRYRQELLRVLVPGGYYLLTLAGPEDGYYGSLPSSADKIVVDPVNNIPSKLFTREEIQSEFLEFDQVCFQENRKCNTMHGKDYARQTLMFIMQKNAI